MTEEKRKYATVLIAYDEESEIPGFHANMECLGGKIIAVQFNDAFAEMEQMEDKLKALELGLPTP